MAVPLKTLASCDEEPSNCWAFHWETCTWNEIQHFGREILLQRIAVATRLVLTAGVCSNLPLLLFPNPWQGSQDAQFSTAGAGERSAKSCFRYERAGKKRELPNAVKPVGLMDGPLVLGKKVKGLNFMVCLILWQVHTQKESSSQRWPMMRSLRIPYSQLRFFAIIWLKKKKKRTWPRDHDECALSNECNKAHIYSY